jgi:type VI secretion system protein ImpA
MMLRLLRCAPLTQSRNFGNLGLRELQYASGEVPAPKGVEAPDSGDVTAAFKDTAPELLLANLAAVGAAMANIRAIDKVFSDNLGGMGPSLDAAVKLLLQIQKALGAHVEAPVLVEEEAEAEGAMDGEVDGTGAPAAVSGGGGGGQIGSSRDVTVMLDRILAYYARFEPSSPVPLILSRAKRLVGADFMTIMKDLAPQGVNDVTMISGDEG